MDWLNIHRSTLAAAEFLGCDPVQRATWLCLMAYCADQENGGRIDGAGDWGDRKWQQVVRVTKIEAHDKCPLWSWESGALTVWAYPVDKEEEVRRNRENGKTGGRPPKPRGNQVVFGGLPSGLPSGLTQSITQTEPSAPISAETERKGKEREEEEEEHPPKPPQAKISASEWIPLQEHRDLASVRNVDADLQLSRFRERNNGQTDTDQGWSVRFRQWLGSSKPERSLSREAVASPTIEEWMSFARSINDCGILGKWPKQAAEAGWQENQAKGWRYVSDWQADCRARVKRWEANEATQAQRRRS